MTHPMVKTTGYSLAGKKAHTLTIGLIYPQAQIKADIVNYFCWEQIIFFQFHASCQVDFLEEDMRMRTHLTGHLARSKRLLVSH